VCGQSTVRVHNMVRDMVTHDTKGSDIRVSATPFNTKNRERLEKAKPYNIPCFGGIPSAALSVFNDEMKTDSKQLSFKFPGYVVDKFVQSKMTKVRTMVTDCQMEFTDDVSSYAFERLGRFADAFEQLPPDSIHDPKEWSSFVQGHVEDPKWQEKLHFDHVLGLFGFTDDVSAKIRQRKYKEKNKKGEEEESTFEQFGVRWLSKALSGFKPDGCMTDVVNLVYAMTGEPPEKDPTEQDVIRKLENFGKLLRQCSASTFRDVWVPEKLLHDAEADDMLVWVLLRYVHEKMGSTLEVRVQLPDDTRFDEKKNCWEKLSLTNVFKDPDSQNLDALLKFHMK